MTANRIFRAIFGSIGVLLSASSLRAAEAPQSRYESEIKTCAANLKQRLDKSLSSVPNFSTLHEMNQWVSVHLPPEVSKRLSSAGNEINTVLREGQKSGLIHGTFHNIQALSELMYWKSHQHFDGLSFCSMSGEKEGVVQEIFDDQIRLSLDLGRNSIQNVFKKLGIDDTHYVGKVIIYGAIFQLAKIEWTDAQMVSLVKYQPPLP